MKYTSSRKHTNRNRSNSWKLSGWRSRGEKTKTEIVQNIRRLFFRSRSSGVASGVFTWTRSEISYVIERVTCGTLDGVVVAIRFHCLSVATNEMQKSSWCSQKLVLIDILYFIYNIIYFVCNIYACTPSLLWLTLYGMVCIMTQKLFLAFVLSSPMKWRKFGMN